MSAQLPPVGVPGGVLRVELDGTLETFDHRFLAGHRESYGADLSSPALGSDRIPYLADADARLGRITGNAGYRLNLGALTTDAQVSRGTGVLGLSLGLTRQITVFGRLPLVQARVQSRLGVNTTGADAGLNPAVNQISFFDQFDAALGTLSAKLAAGDYDANPTTRALAVATLANGTALRERSVRAHSRSQHGLAGIAHRCESSRHCDHRTDHGSSDYAGDESRGARLRADTGSARAADRRCRVAAAYR